MYNSLTLKIYFSAAFWILVTIYKIGYHYYGKQEVIRLGNNLKNIIIVQDLRIYHVSNLTVSQNAFKIPDLFASLFLSC